MSHHGTDGGGSVDALSVLELLAQQAPPERLAELLDGAREAGRPAAELAHLERAVQLATGVAQSLARREQRGLALDALADTVRDLTHPYDLDGLLRLIVRRARRLLDLDLACVTLRDAHGTRVLHSSEGGLTVLDPAGCTAALEREGLGGLVHVLGGPAWTEDYLTDDRFPHVPAVDRLVRDEGLRAVLAVPLRIGDTVLGLLYGGDRRARRFADGELGLLAPLADLAAVATEKAGLLDQTRAEVTELEQDSSRARTALTRMRYIGEAHGRIMNLVLSGGDLLGVAKTAGDALDACVLVRDPGGRTLAAAGEVPAFDEDAVAKASLDAHAGRRPVRAPAGDDTPRAGAPAQTWVAPVIAGSEDLGVLVVSAATPLTGEDERLLELAAQSVAFLLLMQRSTAVAEGPVRDELLDDLLAEPQHAPQQIAQRARRLGIDLRKPHVLVVARPEGGEQGRAVVWASSYAYRMAGLKTVQGGCIVLLLPGVDASAAAKAVSAELAPLLGHPVSVGAAGPGWSPDSVARLSQEAMRCLDAMSALGGAGAAASVDDLGFLGLLLSDDHDVDGFIESAIGPVLDYDAERFTDLTRTLEAYFASGASPTNAAEALHVHPNTVSRRLERIGELLGTEWQKPGQVLEVQLALRLQRTRDVLARRRTALVADPE
ncbi:helix-turn-helix domain-containing protein [Streptomyces sp. SKN60]|uniref:helix-turn-helix domain-containing protein n=1 Tax=Streptomyces sp. SKN60 TaxID=2855506 RepID=UPI0022456286|nr:helix-turn-helix domain-containing protein [Streptomyces sp. SKN60]MCX2179974.1 helix-turn-helix domain-containing protein [Streptomyces sp. SKN60]